MQIACSPAGIVDINQPAQGIMDITQAEFGGLVLDTSQTANRHALESIGKSFYKKNNSTIVIENPKEMYSRMEGMVMKAGSSGLHFPLGIAPSLKPDSTHTDLNETLQTLASESIQVCHRAQCRDLVVEPLFAGIPKEEAWEVNRKLYLSLLGTARENDVRILLINQCRNVSGHLVRGLCSDGRIASEWVDRLNEEACEERFGFCMDVGICNLCGQNMYDFITALGNRMKAVILRECDGSREQSLLPFTAAYGGSSRTDWLNFFRGMREIAFDGVLVMNLEDTSAAVSPSIRPSLLQYAKTVADYFQWQIQMESSLQKYSSRVLFGAGNMCRNYMKCYGDAYPPLFTCDNNEKLWGTKFCGLTVESPEKLRHLSEDTAIYICNIYYREIEQQLRDMGLQNPIEFFNDEYMPSFYFDRLEMSKDVGGKK